MKRTETSLITKSDQIGPNHQLLHLRTARTAWSESDQPVRPGHSCISCLPLKSSVLMAASFRRTDLVVAASWIERYSGRL